MAAFLGILGGSGLYDLPGLVDIQDIHVETPWGQPSDSLRVGRVGKTKVAFLARHGRGHRYPPSAIPYKANIHAMKSLGVTHLISVSACGSFKEDLPPGLFVLVDQFVDRTYGRDSSFFGTGCVAHVSMAHPTSPFLMDVLEAAALKSGILVRRGGTYLCMEGPQFSSYAESMTYKAAGYDVIGMTNMPEAKLAREAELPYATVAMVTDYDCWHDDHEAVDVASVLKIMHGNADKARRLVATLAADFPAHPPACPIGSDKALDYALVTPKEHRDPLMVQKLSIVAGRVL